MLKYYIVLFAIVGMVLFYIFIQDPCNQTLRTDFTNKYPDYEILNSTAGEVTTENVYCYVYYEKPDSKQIYKDTWLYQNSGNGWAFSNIIETQKIE